MTTSKALFEVTTYTGGKPRPPIAKVRMTRTRTVSEPPGVVTSSRIWLVAR